MDRLLPSSVQETIVASEPLRGDKAEKSKMVGHPRRRNLYLAALCANLTSVAAGCAMAWSSPSIPKMKDEGLIDDYQGAWLTSLLAVGAAIGPFLAYRLVDKIGRKTTLMCDMVLLILSWILLGFAPYIASSLPTSGGVDTISVMYVARFLSGLSVGCMFMVTPLYIAEISDSHVRSALGSLMQLFLIFGFLVAYCLGPYYSATVLIAASIVPPVVCLAALVIVVPESPLYLLKQDNHEAADKALQWLRQQNDVVLEIVDFQKSLEESRSTDMVTWFRLLTTRGHLTCLSYGTILIFFQQFAGVNVVLFYSEAIFKMTSSDLSPAKVTIIVGIVFMFASSFAPLLTRSFGMKKLLILSSVVCGIFQGVLAVYFYLDQIKYDLEFYKWVPVMGIIVFLSFHSIGLGPLAWAVMAEFYSPSIKAKGSALTASSAWIYVFILTKFFPTVTLTLGPAICFAVFSGVCAFSTLYICLVLPDTSGMSLPQIQRLVYGESS